MSRGEVIWSGGKGRQRSSSSFVLEQLDSRAPACGLNLCVVHSPAEAEPPVVGFLPLLLSPHVCVSAVAFATRCPTYVNELNLDLRPNYRSASGSSSSNESSADKCSDHVWQSVFVCSFFFPQFHSLPASCLAPELICSSRCEAVSSALVLPIRLTQRR